MPMCSARKRSRAALDNCVISVPMSSILPLSGWAMPQRRLSRVDFPLPEGPSNRVRVPFSSEKDSIEILNDRSPGQAKETPDILMMPGAGSEFWMFCATTITPRKTT